MLSGEVIFKAANKVKPGTIVRIGYRTELPVRAEFKKKGIKIQKFTETSVRLGVSYNHIAEVVARNQQKESPTRHITNNYVWLLKNKVRYNSKTGKLYLCVANFNRGHHTKSFYKVTYENGSSLIFSKDNFLKSAEANYVIDSYWNNNSSAPEVKNISFENIYKIGVEEDPWFILGGDPVGEC